MFGVEVLVDLAAEVVLDDLAELGVVHDSREDLLVLVHPADEGVHEDLVEPEAEVLQRVGLCLVGDLLVRRELCLAWLYEEFMSGRPEASGEEASQFLAKTLRLKF